MIQQRGDEPSTWRPSVVGDDHQLSFATIDQPNEKNRTTVAPIAEKRDKDRKKRRVEGKGSDGEIGKAREEENMESGEAEGKR